MDPVNILIALNLIATIGANLTGAKRGFRSSTAASKERPKGFLQSVPPNLSALVFVFIGLGIFRVGTADYDPGLLPARLAGLAIFAAFSWIQISAFKSLGQFYSQDIVVLKNHMIVKKGLYGFIRHPQYLSQILSDAGAVLAVLSYPAAVLVLIEIPILIMRARAEDALFAKHFGHEFSEYRARTGFMFPKFRKTLKV
ncbi:MAG: methyltransferase family protein [Bacteroidota bacterium]